MEWCGMNIEWTLCSERMPPNDQKTIFRRMDKEKFLFTKNVADAHSLIFYVKNIDVLQWTPYTKEKWEFLNK